MEVHLLDLHLQLHSKEERERESCWRSELWTCLCHQRRSLQNFGQCLFGSILSCFIGLPVVLLVTERVCCHGYMFILFIILLCLIDGMYADWFHEFWLLVRSYSSLCCSDYLLLGVQKCELKNKEFRTIFHRNFHGSCRVPILLKRSNARGARINAPGIWFD